MLAVARSFEAIAIIGALACGCGQSRANQATSSGGTTSAGTGGAGATSGAGGGQGGSAGTGLCADGPIYGHEYRIEGADAAVDIEAFRCVEEITESLVISATNLADLGGLERLRSIGRDLIIGGAEAAAGNASLASLAGLDALESVGGALEIANNPRLGTLQGLQGLRNIGGDVRMYAQSTSLAGLGGPLAVAGNFSVWGAPLEDFVDAESGISIGGKLALHSNANLTSLEGLDRWEFSGIELEENPRLSTLAGWSPAADWNGDIKLASNAMLADLSALSSLETLGSLSAAGAHAFADFKGLSNVRTIDRLEIGGGSMDNVRGFENLTRIEILDLSFSFIENFRGLEAVETLGQLYLLGNERLVSFEGLEALQRIDGRIVMLGNGFTQENKDAFALRFGKTCECPTQVMSCVCSGLCSCQ